MPWRKAGRVICTGNTFFCKTVTPPRVGANYPDDGCNFETYTNHEMLEIESLGPLVTLAPGESSAHQERWFQHVFDAAPAAR